MWRRALGGRCGGVEGVFSLSLPFFMLLFSPRSLKSDSSDLSVLWFIEMYCWKCTGQGFLPTPAGSSLVLSVVLSLSPLGLQSCTTGRASLLFLSPRGRCVRLVCACVHTQVMLLMLPMMIRVMNRHSQGWGCCVMMSSLALRKGAGGQHDLSPVRQTERRGEERGGEKHERERVIKRDKELEKYSFT